MAANFRASPERCIPKLLVGWKEKDNGGAIDFNDSDPPGVNLDKGDCVWKYLPIETASA